METSAGGRRRTGSLTSLLMARPPGHLFPMWEGIALLADASPLLASSSAGFLSSHFSLLTSCWSPGCYWTQRGEQGWHWMRSLLHAAVVKSKKQQTKIWCHLMTYCKTLWHTQENFLSFLGRNRLLSINLAKWRSDSVKVPLLPLFI